MGPMAKEKKIYLDTFVFMDILSGKSDVAEKAVSYLRRITSGHGIVSSVVLTELCFHVKRRGSREKADEVLSYIQSLPGLEIIPLSNEISVAAGRLRAKYFRKIPKKLTYFDCVHLATAIEEKCDVFVTGDRGFRDIEEVEMEIY